MVLNGSIAALNITICASSSSLCSYFPPQETISLAAIPTILASGSSDTRMITAGTNSLDCAYGHANDNLLKKTAKFLNEIRVKGGNDKVSKLSNDRNLAQVPNRMKYRASRMLGKVFINLSDLKPVPLSTEKAFVLATKEIVSRSTWLHFRWGKAEASDVF